jgi:predicted protein tyrosine phosphatase
MTLPNPTRFKNVFVLCTGRCGSQTFSRACEHFTNYTAGHETRSRMLGQDRLAFPDSHIEADNRLSWILGRLEKKFGDDALYVHLTRDASKVAASYDTRWDHRFSLIDGYNRSILMQSVYNEGAAVDLVETVTANIEAFLANKSHVIKIDIDAPQQEFRRFVEMIGAEGDVEAAVAEFSVRHNQASSPSIVSKNNRLMRPHELQAAYSEIKSEVATRVAQERSQRLEAQNALKKLKRDFKRFRKWALILALPMLILLLPVWLPIALFRTLRRRKTSMPKQKKKYAIIFEAFQKRLSEGATSALDLLNTAGSELPPGTIDLFRAMDATCDQEWLDYMNSWAASRDLPFFHLVDGDEVRFHRITFPKLENVGSRTLVTVIIPCYNSEGTVRQAIQSILNQSWRNLELIAVDDASLDRTGTILDQIASEDSRVRVLHNAVNVGPYVSKNRALRLAKGVYITGHDADDIALPNRIADQMKSIDLNPEAKATIGYMVRLTEAGSFTSPVTSPMRTYDGIVGLCSISMLVETQTLREVFGGWDSVRFGADSELIERMTLVLKNSFVFSQKIIMLCLSAENNLTNDPVTGINTLNGLSITRKSYQQAYRHWHKAAPVSELKVPFPHNPRKFSAPEKMLVHPADVHRLIEDD